MNIRSEVERDEMLGSENGKAAALLLDRENDIPFLIARVSEDTYPTDIDEVAVRSLAYLLLIEAFADLNTLKRLRQYVDFDIKNYRGENAVLVAVKAGRVDVLEWLTNDVGLTIHVKDSVGVGPIALAIEHDQSAMLQELLKMPREYTVWQLVFGGCDETYRKENEETIPTTYGLLNKAFTWGSWSVFLWLIMPTKEGGYGVAFDPWDLGRWYKDIPLNSLKNKILDAYIPYHLDKWIAENKFVEAAQWIEYLLDLNGKRTNYLFPEKKYPFPEKNREQLFSYYIRLGQWIDMSNRYLNARLYCPDDNFLGRLNYEMAQLIFSGNAVLDERGSVDLHQTILSRQRLQDVFHQSVASDELKRAVLAYQYVYEEPYEGAKDLLACFHALFSGITSPTKYTGNDAWTLEAIQYYIKYYAKVCPDLLLNQRLSFSIGKRAKKNESEKANEAGIWHRHFARTPVESLYLDVASQTSLVEVNTHTQGFTPLVKPSDPISIAIVNGDLSALTELLKDIAMIEKATQSFLDVPASSRGRYVEENRFKASMILHSTLVCSTEHLYSSPIATAIMSNQEEVVKFLLAYAKEIAKEDYWQHIEWLYYYCYQSRWSCSRSYSTSANMRSLLFFNCWKERLDKSTIAANRWAIDCFNDYGGYPSILKQLILEYKKLIHFLFVLDRKEELVDTKKTFIGILSRAHEYYEGCRDSASLTLITGYEMARLIMYGEINSINDLLDHSSILSLSQQRAVFAYEYLAGDTSEPANLLRQRMNKLLCEKIGSSVCREGWMAEAVLAYFDRYNASRPSLLLEPMFLQTVSRLGSVGVFHAPGTFFGRGNAALVPNANVTATVGYQK